MPTFLGANARLVSAVVCAALLSACGGGGSSRPEPDPAGSSGSGVVTTLAGSTSAGSANGIGAAASFNGPMGIATDIQGNVYVAEFNNNLIRKVTPAGVVTTLAGSGSSGSANGMGTAASFSAPSGVAVDTSGNVYVADAFNQMIRKITPAGVVSTLAGSTTPGGTDATGTAASFRGPSGVAVDTSGNVYVADSGNLSIRKITPAGVVSPGRQRQPGQHQWHRHRRQLHRTQSGRGGCLRQRLCGRTFQQPDPKDHGGGCGQHLGRHRLCRQCRRHRDSRQFRRSDGGDGGCLRQCLRLQHR